MMILLLSGFGGGGLMGLPPGERDAAYLRCAPADSLIYIEWSARGSGVAGGKGFDGLAADPEVTQFLGEVRKTIRDTIERESAGSGSEQARVAGEHIPTLIETLLMESGCFYVDFDPEAVQNPPPGVDLANLAVAGLQATLIVNAGKNADDVTRRLSELIPALSGGETPDASLDHYQVVPLPGGLTLTLHRHETYLILGFGEGSVDRAVAGLKGETKDGLGTNSRFTAAFEKTKVDRVGTVCWVDLKEIRGQLETAVPVFGAMAVQMMKSVHADALDGMAVVSGLDAEGQLTSRSFVETGGSTEGILALAAGRGLNAEDFKHVPADADMVMSFTFDGSQVISAARSVLMGVTPGLEAEFDRTLDQLKSELGFSIRDDFLTAFGQQWTLFDAPSTGGLYVTAPMLTLEVKDKAKAADVFTKLMTIVENALPGSFGGRFRVRGVFLEDKEFLGRKIYYINTVGDDVPVAPAFCLTDTHLIAALHPQTIKAYLRLQDDGDTGFGKTFAGHAPASGDVICYTYFEAASLVQKLYSFAPYVAQLAFSELQSSRFEMDVFSFPSSRAIVPYLNDSHGTVVRTKDGILSSGTSVLPISPWMPILGLFPAWTVRQTFDAAPPIQLENGF